MENKVYVTPNVYAKSKNVLPQRVYNWIQRNGCPYVEQGGRILVNPEEVDRWIERKRHKDGNGNTC